MSSSIIILNLQVEKLRPGGMTRHSIDSTWRSLDVNPFYIKNSANSIGNTKKTFIVELVIDLSGRGLT